MALIKPQPPPHLDRLLEVSEVPRCFGMPPSAPGPPGRTRLERLAAGILAAEPV